MSDGQEPDEPDPTLAADGRGEGELTAHVAGNSMYASAASFEDLPLSPELLQARSSRTIGFVRIRQVSSTACTFCLDCAQEGCCCSLEPSSAAPHNEHRVLQLYYISLT